MNYIDKQKNDYRNNQEAYIKKFTTKYDLSEVRENLFVDIRYSEIKFTFNENKIIVDLLFHVAGNFNLPQGAIKTKIVTPGFEINDLTIIDTNLKVNSNFAYGFPDASKIFTSRFIVDQNENDFLQQNPNAIFDMYAYFVLNTQQLEGLNLSNEVVNNFISDLNRVQIKYQIDLRQKNLIDSKYGFTHNVNQLSSLKIISEIKQINKPTIKSKQFNEFVPITFILQNYQNISTGFKTIFYLRKHNSNSIRINLKNFKIVYFDDDKTKETNEIKINKIIDTKDSVISYDLENYELSYDEKNNNYQLVPGINGIKFDKDMNGYYLLNLSVIISGKLQNYTIKNGFIYLKSTQELKITFDENDFLEIKNGDNYYEIQES